MPSAGSPDESPRLHPQVIYRLNIETVDKCAGRQAKSNRRPSRHGSPRRSVNHRQASGGRLNGISGPRECRRRQRNVAVSSRSFHCQSYWKLLRPSRSESPTSAACLTDSNEAEVQSDDSQHRFVGLGRGRLSATLNSPQYRNWRTSSIQRNMPVSEPTHRRESDNAERLLPACRRDCRRMGRPQLQELPAYGESWLSCRS